MTTAREMEMAYTEQQQVIAALYAIGNFDLADRIGRCMTTRKQRHYGDGWPYSCRSAACLWCRRPLIRSWWNGICDWSEAATTSSLAIIAIRSPAGLADATRRLRRGLRDVRDRVARRLRRWRTVSFAGLIGGDGRALILVAHESIERREVQDVLYRRWPDVVVKEVEHEEPMWEMTADDAAELGMRRRGVEPLRILVMPQRITRVTVASIFVIEPLPILV